MGTFQATYSGTPPAPTLTRSGVLSHIVAGGGWTTVMTLINNSSAAVPVTVTLHDDNGNTLSLAVTVTNQGATQTTTTSPINATINPKAMLLVSTGDGIPSTSVGWADILSSGTLGGFAIFRQTPQNGAPSEGPVPLQSHSPTTITLPYDDTAGFVMGVWHWRTCQTQWHISQLPSGTIREIKSVFRTCPSLETAILHSYCQRRSL